MAVVAEGQRGRIYLSPTAEQESIAQHAKPTWRPETLLPINPRDLRTPGYGLTKFGDLFTARQLVALTTFSDLVQEARQRALSDATSTGFPSDGKSLADGGIGAHAYASLPIACTPSASAKGGPRTPGPTTSWSRPGPPSLKRV